jgi:hypothetical protein
MEFRVYPNDAIGINICSATGAHVEVRSMWRVYLGSGAVACVVAAATAVATVRLTGPGATGAAGSPTGTAGDTGTSHATSQESARAVAAAFLDAAQRGDKRTAYGPLTADHRARLPPGQDDLKVLRLPAPGDVPPVSRWLIDAGVLADTGRQATFQGRIWRGEAREYGFRLVMDKGGDGGPWRVDAFTSAAFQEE